MFQIRVGDNIIDAENSFPLSLFLAGGRMMNEYTEEGQRPTLEQFTKIGEQLAVGNLATDISGMFSSLQQAALTLNETDATAVAKGGVLLGKAMGGFLSGYTRPLDPLNKLIGTVTGTDAAKDVRQINPDSLSEALTTSGLQSMTKYVDNIAEGLYKIIDQDSGGEIPGLTGTTLRVATREGDIRQPNALLSIFGVRQIPGRTATESVLDSVDMPRYMQNIRSANPKYDRIANIYLSRLLETRLSRLLEEPRFQRMSNEDKRAEIKEQISVTRDYMYDLMDKPGVTPETVYLEYTRKKMMSRPRAEKKFALRMMKESIPNFEGDLANMSLRELNVFEYYVKMYPAYRAAL